MPQITLANSRRFEASQNLPILDAALAASLTLEHSCRNGRCGTCKARVLCGETSLLHVESSLSPDELSSGWILTCARAAISDLQLDIEDLAGLEGIRALSLPARIGSLERLAPDIIRVQLRLPPRTSFRFRAGQYIDVTGPGGVKRSYSIASDPGNPEHLALEIRQVTAGVFSQYWFKAAALSDMVRFRGPMGTFFLRAVDGKDLVFLATGTGIAPIRAMLAELAALPEGLQPATVTLYWGGRVCADLYEEPVDPLGRLRYVPVLSRPDSAWEGARGYVQDVYLQTGPSLERADVYACGSEAMVASSRKVLLAAGLLPQHFHADAFVSSGG